MKHFQLITLSFLALFMLQGCATTTPDVYPNQGIGMNREVVASPAAKISAGSGFSHTGMAGMGQ